jgi:hypothetical protein
MVRLIILFDDGEPSVSFNADVFLTNWVTTSYFKEQSESVVITSDGDGCVSGGDGGVMFL